MNICRCLLAALFFFTTSAWAELAKVSGEEEAAVVEACVEPKGTIAIAEPQTLVHD